MADSPLTGDALASLVDSWALHLRAERKSANTIKSYTISVRRYLAWCVEEDVADAALDRTTLAGWITALLDAGAEGATVASRQQGVRRFTAWLATEDEIGHDPFAQVAAPKLDQKIVEPLTDDELTALLATCNGKTFLDRRDGAIIRIAHESFLRAGDVLQMTVSETDMRRQIAVIRRSKGGTGRLVPFSADAGRALDRYLRLRRTHRLADTDILWLGTQGRGFGYQALYKTLCQRADRAGIRDFHPHRLRHTGATRWLAAKGSVEGAMAVGGWKNPNMLWRYVEATRQTRAIEESRGLDLGNI
jgi:site-specific recombinase XerD